MSNAQVATIDVLKTLDHASISGSYAAVGTPTIFPVRLICFTNNTNGDMFFSYDGVNNMLFIAASSFKLFDLTTNRLNQQQLWCFATGTQFYVKQSTAATTGAVYIECLG
jgi:hypothetical protein